MAIQHTWLWDDKLADGIVRDVGTILFGGWLPSCTNTRLGSGTWVCLFSEEKREIGSYESSDIQY